MDAEIRPEQLARYRATAQRRWAEEQAAIAARRQAARAVAEQAAAMLRQRFGATRVLLFGSLAHEQGFTLTSDIDLAAAGVPRDDYFTAVALNFHGFNAGVERLLEAIVDTVDRSKSTGANWHQELLRQMATEVPGVRPPVFSLPTRNLLDRYRGFRHVVRNVYSFELDPDLMDTLIQQLSEAMAAMRSELLVLADFLEACGNG